ncbi:3-deoxy-7-phosphoheptulonate synthase [Nocardiopsis suaedae]|uniref:Phospho-2-dehydro-3-deoxyheptonate aldolase n=1 Tax=Nocardiopsis suaedae TaxID=3018444 RepID=A0ABT4TNC7_9ACTN|nr:3-deoxy-7-phosphoheptulonate synthase [Nocardiopsis suaedae]MDA2806197.1 3-deoxy-7-phosphoheptulonate synthase [Nocardiopsis suaedae]
MLSRIRTLDALQQPDWGDAEALDRACAELSALPPLVRRGDVLRLRTLLAGAAAGTALVLQAGDCAEDPADCYTGGALRKAGLVDMLGGIMQMNTHLPVVRAGRIAGQFAKPRSRPTETVGGRELPVYRGHIVNAPEPDPALRRADPQRLVAGYQAARQAMRDLGWAPDTAPHPVPQPWTSHEALVLDYELPQVRDDGDGALLASTHWPWIGERTRGLDHAHVDLLSRVVNPVACKVGPNATEEEVAGLCGRLDPGRAPGRLTLIARMGADAVAERLPRLVAAARAAGHPVVWLCDPMHGNTVTTGDGYKTRVLDRIVREVEGFVAAVREGGGVPGGLHLETTPDEVTECADGADRMDTVSTKYTSLCDPRLNPRQALRVVDAWKS